MLEQLSRAQQELNQKHFWTQVIYSVVKKNHKKNYACLTDSQ